jgi:RimJ/RimL family protein N-acetyltransferase
MASLTNEQDIIEDVLRDCVCRYATPDARMFPVFDRENGHFLVIEEGWIGKTHLYNPFVHIELRQSGIWILQDFTNHGIGNDLVQQGIAQDRIVLAYKAPSQRENVEFALAPR